jgi:uncharacterized damage-inducible protein DinB
MRAAALARRLQETAAALVAVVELIGIDQWMALAGRGDWSIGKDAEHVAEALVMHRWIVRRTIGEEVPSRRPSIERMVPTTELSPPQAAALIRRRVDEAASLLLRLTDEQLDLPTRPPRASGQRLGETIERVLISHLDAHRAAIEAKLRHAG